MKALIRDNVAVNACADADLATRFHPDIAALFETVPDDVREGWVRDDAGQWFPPEPPPVQPAETIPASAYVVDIPSFKMRFSPDQLDAIRASENTVVKAFLREIIDDPRTVNVNLALPYVQGAMMLLAGLGLIEADDVVQILAPVAP